MEETNIKDDETDTRQRSKDRNLILSDSKEGSFKHKVLDEFSDDVFEDIHHLDHEQIAENSVEDLHFDDLGFDEEVITHQEMVTDPEEFVDQLLVDQLVRSTYYFP